MADSAGDKTKKATPKRRKQARDDGQKWVSQDLKNGFSLLIGIIILRFYIKHVIIFGVQLMIDCFSLWATSVSPSGVLSHMGSWELWLAEAVGPILGWILLVNILFGAATGGIRLMPQSLIPQFSRVNPIQGFTKLFSMNSVWELAKGFIKLAVLVGIAYLVLNHQLQSYVTLSDGGLYQACVQGLSMVFTVGVWMIAGYLTLGVVDAIWQYTQFEKKLRMTNQEVKDEFEDAEGDPHVKGKLRQNRMQLLRSGMQVLKDANVVIMNPTHFAVAVQWEPQRMDAPYVVLKGQDETALEIRALATKWGVPVVENPPLARQLYQVPVDHPIPEITYQEVATVLAFVMRHDPRRSR